MTLQLHWSESASGMVECLIFYRMHSVDILFHKVPLVPNNFEYFKRAMDGSLIEIGMQVPKLLLSVTVVIWRL